LEFHVDFNLLLPSTASMADFKKSYPERDTCCFSLPTACQMAKAIAQPSPSPSPSKLIEAKLLVAHVEQKAKGKRKAPAKAAKATAKSNKAIKAVYVADKKGLDVKIVEDGTSIKYVCYMLATSMLVILLQMDKKRYALPYR
jgi:hypothetical protein